jgi:hypothetical protein
LNTTAELVRNSVPVRVNVKLRLPTATVPGERLTNVGVGFGIITIKEEVLAAVPLGVVTAIRPDVAPTGTVNVKVVALTTAYELRATPLSVTALVFVKFVPVTVIVVPTTPLVGMKLLTTGGFANTVKANVDVAVPPGVVTLMLPVVAPMGTFTIICVPALLTVSPVANTPLNVTLVAPVKPVPVRATIVPTTPLVGEKLFTTGTLTNTVKGAVVEAVPPGVVTLMLPVVAPIGTVALI